MKLSIFILNLLFVYKATAFSLGEVLINGHGCESKDKPVELETLSATPGAESKRFEFPVQISLDKRKSQLSERKACTIRLPLKVQSDERLIIKNVRQEVGFNLDTKSGANITLEVSDIDLSFDFVSGSTQKDATLTSGTQSVTTRCGSDFMLGLNSSVRGTGLGEGKIFTKSVKMEISSEKCK